jgi:hypothetical protein
MRWSERRSRKGLDLEATLRASRPTPPSHLMRSVSDTLASQRGRASRGRLGFVGALAAATITVLASTGGFSYAASSIVDAARVAAVAVHLSTPAVYRTGPTSSAAQYLGAPTITKLSTTLGSVPVGSRPGTSVTVLGTNLGGITAVSVAGISIDLSTVVNSSTTAATFKVPSSGSSAEGPVTVTNPGGTASFGAFTVEVPPAVGGLSDSAALEPGQVITVTGSGFRGVDLRGGSVKFHGKPATFDVTDDGHIAATVPVGVTAGTVLVTNVAGKLESAAYTVAPGPHVTSFSPTTGTQGTDVKIRGTGFIAGDKVTFGSSAQESVTFDSATQIEATVPADATPGPVTVSDTVGASSSKQTFTPIFQPTLSSLSPSPGTRVGGTLTLAGTHLSGTTAVAFSGTAKPVKPKVLSDSELTVVVPKGAASGNITVTNAAGTSPPLAGFTLLAAPTIDPTGVTAASPAIAGDTVTITGANFVDTDAQHVVVFFGKASAQATVGSSTSISVVIPVGATTGKPKVVEAGGTAIAKQTVTIAGAPAVTSITPSAQIADGTHTIVIKGKGLTGTNAANPTVTFTGGATGAVQPGATATAVTVTVTAGAEPGPVTVTANSGTGTSKTFTPIKQPAPSSLWPSQGQKVGGTLSIFGTHLSGATSVAFAGTAKPVKPKVISDSALTVVVPKGVASGTITVTNAAGSGSVNGFVVIPPPTIVSVPSDAMVGDSVTITGTNFVDTDAVPVTVKFGKAVATPTSITGGGTTIQVVVPTGAATGKIQVVTIAGTATSKTTFTVISGPKVIGVPSSAKAGQTVRITGRHFTSTSSVKFNGVEATSFHVVSDSVIEAVVPSGAGTGPVTVTNRAGSSASVRSTRATG